MLSRHGLPQPIRNFEPPPTPTSSDVSAGVSGVCRGCARDIFNASLCRDLTWIASHPSATSLSYAVSYGRLARDIYASTLDGCHWCKVVGNAILTNSELEYWMRDWNGSRSDGASLFSSSNDGKEVESEQNQEDGAAENEDVNAEDESEEDEDPDDGTNHGGFLSMESLDCTAEADITVEFLRYPGSQLFNLVKVTVEVVPSGQGDCSLQEMTVGDGAVVMTLEVICEGMNKPSPFHTSANVKEKDITQAAPIFEGKWAAVSAADLNDWAPHAESWLQHCNDNDGASCAASGTFQATRLIDVRDPNHPRLAISADDAQDGAHKYAVLSYVWGPKQDYILTKATISELCRGLDLSRTPRTISDAIGVAHRLGFHYLWVDALCIIQDSAEDKAKELPRMADVYKESSLCIVAASAAAASEGFLKPPSPPRYLVEPFQISLDSPDGSSATLTFAYRAPYMASADPISSRAWTLQERVLSKRLLLFGRSGVMWMCRERSINPGAAPDAGPPYQTSLGPNMKENESSDEHDQAEIMDRWMAIRADYSEMDLTYCADKLLAISALATEVGHRTGWKYLAGMWEHNLFSELHWRSTKRSPSGEDLILKPEKVRKAGFIAPSWSWASIGLGGIVDSEGERSDREAFDLTILECHVDTDPTFPFGPVTGGFLKVQARAVELAWRPAEDTEPMWDISLVDEQDLTSVGTPYIVGDGSLDPLDEHLDPALKLICLGMSKIKLGRQRIQPVEGLLLLPGESVGGTFHRIGFFRMNAPSIFDGAMVKTFIIE